MYKLLLTSLALVFLGGSVAVAQPADRPPQPQPGERAPQPQPGQRAPQPPGARPSDPIGDNLFPPELIMRCAAEIALTDEQKELIKTHAEKAQASFRELQPKLDQEVQAMGALVKEENPDTEKALAQLDKVLAAEREVKRVQIGLMISLKKVLTPGQVAQVQEARQKMMAEGRGRQPGGDVPQSLQIKMQQVQRQAQQMKAEGHDLAPIQQAMQQLGPLMRDKKFAEAEAVLDEALKALGEAAPAPAK
jgi:Spy/CpxP family protein refolding chaperone